MGRKSSYVPLTQEELDAPSSEFTVAPQSRVAGSTILNELLKHVTDGTGWEHLEEPAASRTRLRRGARRGELSSLYDFVKGNPVFSPERVESFRRLAVLEAEVAGRLS